MDDRSRQDVLGVVDRVRRKLTLVRAAERAAVAGTLAAGVGAALIFARMAADWSEPTGLVVCALAAIALTAVCRRGMRRRLGVDVATVGIVATVCGLALAVTIIAIVIGRTLVTPWQTVAALIGTAMLLAAAVSAMTPVSRLTAARQLDVRFGLAERLSTAVELADSERRDTPEATAVYAQAVRATRSTGALEAPLWRRTRRTPAALAITLLVCGTLAWVAQPSRPAGPAELLAGRSELTDEQREQLAAELLRLAERARDDPALAEALRRAAEAAEGENPAELARRMERIGSGDRRLMDRLAAALAGILGAPGGDGAGTGGGDGGEASETRPQEPPPAPERVLVYDPLYEDANGAAGTGAPETGDGEFRTYDSAWRRAQERAAGRLNRGAVPTRYRQVLRGYFAAE